MEYTTCYSIVEKKLFVCKTAIDDFKTILETVGGEQECSRAEKLMQQITLVEDQPSSRALSLQTSGKVKQRAKVSRYRSYTYVSPLHIDKHCYKLRPIFDCHRPMDPF